MSHPESEQWLLAAWKQLELDFQNGKFTPQDEYDVQGHLYHCLFQTKGELTPAEKILVTLEWRNVDLAVIREGSRNPQFWAQRLDFSKKREVEPTQRPLLLVQIKETHLASLTQLGLYEDFRRWLLYGKKKVAKDIEKLKSLVRDHDAAKPFIAFFIRGADPKGMDGASQLWCSEFASEIASQGVAFLYGPKRET